MKMIEIKNVSVTFNNKKKEINAVNNVSLSIKEGEIYGIVGGSGAGKSTLIRTINGLQKPTKGEVIVNGKNIKKLSRKELREARKDIGMIFQHFNLLSRKTVRKNIELALKVQGIAKNDRDNRIKELLELVGLSEKGDVYPAELSGGQKQRVGIARALASSPKVLLCDEATSALDVQTTKEIVEILKNINAKLGITIVFITHQLEVAKSLFHNIAVISKGAIVEKNTTYNIFTSPVNELTKELVKREINIPKEIIKKIDGRILNIIYKGEKSVKPVINNISKKYAVELNILYGEIEYIQDKPVGLLVVSIKGSIIEIEKVIDYLNNNVESVNNYVLREEVI